MKRLAALLILLTASAFAQGPPASPAAALPELERRLIGSVWHWSGRGKNEETITFAAGGKAAWKSPSGEPGSLTWKVADEKSIEGTFEWREVDKKRVEMGHHYTITFSPDLQIGQSKEDTIRPRQVHWLSGGSEAAPVTPAADPPPPFAAALFGVPAASPAAPAAPPPPLAPPPPSVPARPLPDGKNAPIPLEPLPRAR